mmetsp:Transcript_11465/g.29000  ORF Transcript_11465/g.29000 Transcript_11465/m.29000 type:complete len:271 (+) Transcript_11465:1455-2267(+)
MRSVVVLPGTVVDLIGAGSTVVVALRQVVVASTFVGLDHELVVVVTRVAVVAVSGVVLLVEVKHELQVGGHFNDVFSVVLSTSSERVLVAGVFGTKTEDSVSVNNHGACAFSGTVGVEGLNGGTSGVLEGASSKIENTVFNHLLVDRVHPFIRISHVVFAVLVEETLLVVLLLRDGSINQLFVKVTLSCLLTLLVLSLGNLSVGMHGMHEFAFNAELAGINLVSEAVVRGNGGAGGTNEGGDSEEELHLDNILSLCGCVNVRVVVHVDEL